MTSWSNLEELPPERLLSRLRLFAENLVQEDPQLADDLVQDTWLALQRKGTTHWRGRMRGLLFRHRRGEQRRRFHERAAAHAEAAPDVVQVTELLRELTDHVLALDEPYRTTLLLRFVEECPRREIARRMSCPVSTVQSRLTRGLARLRERLGADPESRARWSHALSPHASALPLLGLLMTKKALVTVACATVLLLAGGHAVLSSDEREPREDPVAPEAESSSSVAGLGDAPESMQSATPASRTAIEPTPEADDEGADDEAEARSSPGSVDEPTARTADLAGTLRIPTAWTFTEFELATHGDPVPRSRKGRMPRTPTDERRAFHEVPFTFLDVEVGTRVLVFRPIEFYVEVVVPDDGRDDVVVEVPPPAVAHVTVLDALTGAVVEGGSLTWSSAVPASVRSYRANDAERDGAEPFRFQAPEGRVSLFLDHPDYWAEETEHELGAGATAITLEVPPSPAVVLAFYDEAGQPTRHPRLGWSSFDGPGTTIGQAAVDDAFHKVRVTLSEPGTYRVHLTADGLEGVRDPEPFELTVYRGERLEHDLVLRAK